MDLAKLTPTGYPAVSLLMPTHRTAPESLQDPIRLRNLLAEAGRRLADDPAVPPATATAILEQLTAAAERVDLRHSGEGLALFASPGRVHVRLLDGPAPERVVVGDTFEVRDVLADAARRHRYWALVLSEQPTRLWSGRGGELVEVTTHGFPFTHEGPGGALGLPRDYGQEPSRHRREHHRRFFREVAAALSTIDTMDPRPLFVMGVQRYLTHFAEAWPHPVAGTVPGSHDRATAHELGELLAPVRAEHESAVQSAALQALNTARGANRFAAGLPETATLAGEGRGAHLLVEEDYTAAAVDDVVEAVARQGGEVTFLPDGALAGHGHIALILRY